MSVANLHYSRPGLLTSPQIGLLLDSALSASTKRAYGLDMAQFSTWCQQHGHTPLPASNSVVAAYLADLASLTDGHGNYAYAVSTVRRKIAAVNSAHTTNGYPSPGAHPQIAAMLSGLARVRSDQQRAIAQPLLLNDLRIILEAMDTRWPASVSTVRNAAMLSLGWAGAFRRSEVTKLLWSDIEIVPGQGLIVRLRKSKSDQTGKGEVKAIPYGTDLTTCVPCLLIRWLAVYESESITDRMRTSLQRHERHICRQQVELPQGGPIFCQINRHGSMAQHTSISGDALNKVLQRSVRRSGLSGNFSAHSLRSGFITQALRNGATLNAVMRQSGHKSVSVMRGYDRDYNAMAGNAVTKVGL